MFLVRTVGETGWRRVDSADGTADEVTMGLGQTRRPRRMAARQESSSKEFQRPSWSLFACLWVGRPEPVRQRAGRGFCAVAADSCCSDSHLHHGPHPIARAHTPHDIHAIYSTQIHAHLRPGKTDRQVTRNRARCGVLPASCAALSSAAPSLGGPHRACIYGRHRHRRCGPWARASQRWRPSDAASCK